MLKVYTCIATQHDLRLVALAACICALASFTAVNLLHHVGRSESEMRRVWLAVAAIATGFGIWATHFIAMLAFQPAVSSGYNIALT
ncbi:MAG: bifunctional diguanylate cyclase/phosphodiesterase, partial [Mesorhizobium sp.]